MKVKDLIKELQNYDQELDIWIESLEGDFSVFDVDRIIYNPEDYGNGGLVILPESF